LNKNSPKVEENSPKLIKTKLISENSKITTKLIIYLPNEASYLRTTSVLLNKNSLSSHLFIVIE